MAEVGKIWWKAYSDGDNTGYENILYLSGISKDGYELWDQNELPDPEERPWSIFTDPVFYYHNNPDDSTFEIVIEDLIIPINCKKLFYPVNGKRMASGSGSGRIERNHLYGLNNLSITSAVTNMYRTFAGGVIETLSLSDFYSFDTSNVTNMGSTFSGCGLTSFNFDSNFNTSNVTDMSYMFNANNFTSLDLSSTFDTRKVTNMRSMFDSCVYLEELDISSFDLSHVTNTFHMFSRDFLLTTIYVAPNTDWNSIASITNSEDMFDRCYELVGGNGTAHGNSTAVNDNNKTKARIDKAGQAGYFTLARRTIETYATGEGSLTGAGTYDYGTPVQIIASPDNGYFIKTFTKTADSETESLIDSDTVSPVLLSFEVRKNMRFEAVFDFRESWDLEVTQEGTEYSIQGDGTYRYLDTPTLIADLNAELAAFLGWFDINGDLVSSNNPYTLLMPNENVLLVAKFGPTPFSDEVVRQFILRNGNGEICKLTSKDSNIFLNEPSNLGFEKGIGAIRFGNTEEVYKELYSLPTPSGTLMFHEDNLVDNYDAYNKFIRFLMVKPMTLWYKIPIKDEKDVFHIPVEITSVTKTEVDLNTSLACEINFHATGFWRYTQSSVSDNDSIVNRGDLYSGAQITASKSDESPFTNPIITFESNGDIYGKVALEGTFTKIIIDTRDKEQGLILFNGDTTPLDSPFSYINFAESDGKAAFPFPKIKNGVITDINFTYDNYDGESINVIVIYDEEYVSV